MDDLKSHMRQRGLGPKRVAKQEEKEEDDAPAEAASGEEGGAPSWSDGRLARCARRLEAWRFLLIDDAVAAAAPLILAAAAAWGGTRATVAVGSFAFWALYRVLPPWRRPLGVRVVCISDTHGCHRELVVPPGDLLIHAGDFTKFGRRADAEDFNEWLGGLPFKAKVVVNGNHENNADWQRDAPAILSNATFLKNGGARVCGVDVYGTDFCWPMRQASPLYALIPAAVDVVVAHGPAFRHADSAPPPEELRGGGGGGGADAGGAPRGCRALLAAMARVRPRLVVSGHLHDAHGLRHGGGTVRGTTFVNAANCRGGYSLGWKPIVVDL